MAWAATARQNQAVGATTPTTVDLNGTVAGNAIFVAISTNGSSAPTITVSDDVNGSYTQAAVATNGVQRTALWYFLNIAGGDVTITVGHSPALDTSVWCHEFSGGPTSDALSGTPSTNTGTGTAQSTGSMTPEDDDVLLMAVVGHNNHVNSWTINAGGEGFTSSDSWVPGEGGTGQPGSFVYKIISGAPGTPSHSWTINGTSGAWAALIAAFVPFVDPGRKFILTRPA